MMSHVVLETEKMKARSKQIKGLQLLFLALPPTNCLLLECLIDMLHRVSRISENMMTAQSLGTVFAPCLLCPRKVSVLMFKILSPLTLDPHDLLIDENLVTCCYSFVN